MAEFDVGSAQVSDLANAMVDFSVDALDTDGAGSELETTWQNTYWSTDYGYYDTIPEFQNAVDMKALWTVGAGFQADEATTMLLDSIKGNGKDSFNSILENMIKCKTISQDSFAEIIRDESDRLRPLVNLKPLDPGSMVIVQNEKGRIVRYEQVSKTKTPNKRYKPEQIFHLSHDRTADSIHGKRIMSSLKWLILARNEAMDDWKTVLHRNVHPLWIIHADTDDKADIAALTTKMENAYSTKNFMIVPKGAVVPELVATATNASLNPLAWIDSLNDYFYQAVMVPQILYGNAKSFTDASGKIVYLAHEQHVKREQLYVEEQVLGQLNLVIDLEFPASLQNDLISEKEKDPVSGAAEENDTTAELEGPK